MGRRGPLVSECRGVHAVGKLRVGRERDLELDLGGGRWLGGHLGLLCSCSLWDARTRALGCEIADIQNSKSK